MSDHVVDGLLRLADRQVNGILQAMAVALGDDYSATRKKVGRLSRCTKGDGVLSTGDGAARVVVELTDSGAARNWTEYFDIAEQNWDASAALGVVRCPEQNAGQTIRHLGSRRIVVAFDPDQDNAELLRTVLLLLRAAALRAVVRTGTAEIKTAEERILQAVDELGRFDSIKKMSSSIQKSATSIDTECTKIASTVRRLLDEAMSALDGARAAEQKHEVAGALGAA